MSNSTCKPKCEKQNGGQDHRCNSGNDRTPAQKNGDRNRRG